MFFVLLVRSRSAAHFFECCRGETCELNPQCVYMLWTTRSLYVWHFHTCLQLCKVSNTIWNLTNSPHVCDTSKTRKQHSAKSPYTRFMKYVTWCIRLGCVMGADPLLSRDQIKSPLTKMPLNMNKCQPLLIIKVNYGFRSNRFDACFDKYQTYVTLQCDISPLSWRLAYSVLSL